VAKVEEVLQFQEKEGSATEFREDENRLLVREGCNKVGRFLEVAVEADGGRNGTIWLPKGKMGWGWRRFVSEMRRMLEFQGGQIGPSVDEFPPLPGKRVEIEEPAVSGLRYGQSFASVLRSRVGGLERLSSCLLDVFPMTECFEAVWSCDPLWIATLWRLSRFVEGARGGSIAGVFVFGGSRLIVVVLGGGWVYEVEEEVAG
jgi:hypothetical protein